MIWKSWFDTFVGIAILLSLGVALVTYLDADKANRTAATLSALVRYRSDPLMDSMLAIETALRTDEIQRLINDQKPEDAVGWAEKTLKFNQSKNLLKPIQIATFFFDDLFYCLKHEICDAKTSSIFANDVQGVFVLSKSTIDEMNKEHWTWDKNPDHLRGCGFNALFSSMGTSGEIDYATLRKSTCLN
jgi:hypothetical protein